MFASFVTDKIYQNNRIFDKNDPTRLKYFLLKSEFEKYGIDLCTSDKLKGRESLFYIYHDLPKRVKLDSKKNNYALLIESPLIKPCNYVYENHKGFRKIFTWSDEFIDSDKTKYVKINYSFDSEDIVDFLDVSRYHLCVLVVSNKTSRNKNELYSERRSLIRWFENNHPEHFDLFGRGWDQYAFEINVLGKVVNRIPIIKRLTNELFFEQYPSYKGEINNKFDLMKNYKFSISYENIIDESGYITEKMFDSLCCGCVPIYLGADNILDYIPETCFIDRRKYKNNDELYNYISNMSEVEYKSYQRNIHEFLLSTACKKFSVEYFAKTVTKAIMTDLRKKL